MSEMKIPSILNHYYSQKMLDLLKAQTPFLEMSKVYNFNGEQITLSEDEYAHSCPNCGYSVHCDRQDYGDDWQE